MDSFIVKLSFKGKSATIPNITHATTAEEMLTMARNEFQVGEDTLLKLLFKGKIIGQDFLEGDDKNNNDNNDNSQPAFEEGVIIPKSGAKVIVMGTESQGVRKLNSGRSDPTIRGFDDIRLNGKSNANSAVSTFWGPNHTSQHKNYKFCRFQECTDASFGSRPGASTPHAFEARRLLERLATDPGIIAILKSRELIVGTLGEMDPIDDRLMQKKQQEGGCLLGYNTNHGMRIDIKLRADDLSEFRPYCELMATLIHELSHNWVGEHNVLFWTNYGQMRVEYLWEHARLMKGGEFVNGKRTAALAGVMDMILPNNVVGGSGGGSLDDLQIMEHICQAVSAELSREMAQHGIPVQMVAPAISQFGKEMLAAAKDDETIGSGGHRLGSASVSSETTVRESSERQQQMTARQRALEAAERRAREAKKSSGETKKSI